MQRHLKPGGWLELDEYEMGLHSDDESLTEKAHLSRYYRLLFEASSKSGDSGLPPLLHMKGTDNLS